MCVFTVLVGRVTEWPPIGKYLLTRLTICSLIVNLFCFVFFFRLGFLSGNLFLIAPFPDHCLLVPS